MSASTVSLSSWMCLLPSLLLLLPVAVVESRCKASPTLDELLQTEDYVVRAKIEGPYDNSDGKICNTKEVFPVRASVMEVFKGTNAGVGVYPAVGDSILLNYMTGTGYKEFGFYVDEDLNWDSEGYMIFPALQTGCVNTGGDFPVFSISSCFWEGTKGWSSLSEDVKTKLRSTDEWRSTESSEQQKQQQSVGEESSPADSGSSSNMRIDGTAPTTTTTTNGEENSNNEVVPATATITDDAEVEAYAGATPTTSTTNGDKNDELEAGVILPANTNDLSSSTTTTTVPLLLVSCIVLSTMLSII